MKNLIHTTTGMIKNGWVWFICPKCDHCVGFNQKTGEKKTVDHGDTEVIHQGISPDQVGQVFGSELSVKIKID